MTIGELEKRAGIGGDHADRFAFWIAFKSAADPIKEGVAVLRRMIEEREREAEASTHRATRQRRRQATT